MKFNNAAILSLAISMTNYSYAASVSQPTQTTLSTVYVSSSGSHSTSIPTAIPTEIMDFLEDLDNEVLEFIADYEGGAEENDNEIVKRDADADADARWSLRRVMWFLRVSRLY